MEKLSSKKYTIKLIFQEWWGKFLVKYGNNVNINFLLTKHVIEVVEKMLDCRNVKKLGYHKYACSDHPDQITVVPHSCKTRFCNSCGKVATDKWLNKACVSFPNIPYHHLTFTVPQELRDIFLKNHISRKLLFKVSQRIILDWSYERGFIPTITTVLHTFGRDLKFHPHIHMLVSAGGLDLKTQTLWEECHHLPGGMLEKRWKTELLYELCGAKLISINLKRKLHHIHWYVHVARELLLAIVTTNYIGRYTKKPPLAEARIIDYDGYAVVFSFADWSLNKRIVYLKITVEEFIFKLIQHIPPKHFRLIKHGGLLHNRRRKKSLIILKHLFGKIKTKIAKLSSSSSFWRVRQTLYKKIDPLVCKICQKEMKLKELAFWSKTLNKLYLKEV